MLDASNPSHITNGLYPLVIPPGLGVIPRSLFLPLASVWVAWEEAPYAELIWYYLSLRNLSSNGD